MDDILNLFGLAVLGYIFLRYILPIILEVGGFIVWLIGLALVGATILYACGGI